MKAATKSKMRRGLSDRVFDIVNYAILGLVALAVLYPLYFVVIASFSDPDAINTGRVLLWPVGFNTMGYEKIFADAKIWRSYSNTIFYTVLGTTINIFLTMMLAYPLSRKEFFARKPILFLVMFTMYFQGGMIPTYLWMNDLGLYNTPWVMVLLPAINVFNLLIAMNYISANIPEELYEAASIDGCSHITFFTRIVLPLSKAILAVLVLYYAVEIWNAYFDALIYIRNADLHPLQIILRSILLLGQTEQMGTNDVGMAEKVKMAEAVKYSAIVISSIPMLLIYPFVQKHFVKGVMIGAVKG